VWAELPKDPRAGCESLILEYSAHGRICDIERHEARSELEPAGSGRYQPTYAVEAGGFFCSVHL
jgi:hypothetical protein